MLIRVCPDCGEEFRPDVLRCSDCGAELVTRDDEVPEARAHEGSRVSGDAQDSARSIAWSEAARYLVPFADRLAEAGIVFRIGPRLLQGTGGYHGFELRVWDKDREAAVRALAPFAIAESGVTLLDAVADPASPEGEGAGLECPACDAPLVAGAGACPECGLVLDGEGGPAEPTH